MPIYNPLIKVIKQGVSKQYWGKWKNIFKLNGLRYVFFTVFAVFLKC